MNFTDYLWLKLIVLAAIAGLVSFFCRLITGKSIQEVLRERQTLKDHRQRDR